MDNVDLNSNISAQSSVTSQTPAFEQPVSKKRLSPLVIILSIVVLVLAGAAVVLFFMLPKQEDTPTTPNEQQEQTELMDVTEYTDIKLTSYDGLDVSVSEEFEEENLIKGIVTYTKTYETGVETMYIINKKSLTDEQNDTYFTPIYNDIFNKNIEAEWLNETANPHILRTVAMDIPSSDLLTEINNVEYPNTENILTILSLFQGNTYAEANNTSGNYRIHVFALKGDNIIRLNSQISNLQKDFEIEEELHQQCLEEKMEITTYNIQCLSDIFSSGKYDELLQTKANELISSFEIAN